MTQEHRTTIEPAHTTVPVEAVAPEAVAVEQPQPAAPEQPQSDEAAAAAAVSPREAELEAELDKLKDQLLRAVAETENVRRRLEQQAEDRSKYAVSNFAKDIVSVADNLRRALDSIPADARDSDPMAHTLAEGIELTERSLLATLERYGIKRIEAMGQRFDPNLHQAMMEIEDPSRPSGTVVMEMQAGYTIHDRLLRASMVGVSKGGPKPQPGDAGLDTVA